MPADRCPLLALRLGASLFGVSALAKAIVLARQAEPADLRAWADLRSLPVFVWQDLALSAAFVAVLAALTWLLQRQPARFIRPSTARLVGLGLYGLLTAWLMLNAVVTAELSAPLTVGLLRAGGGALSDSLARYATAANGLTLLALLATAALLPMALRRRVAPAWSPRGWALVAVAALGITGLGVRTEAGLLTRGLHRNAALAFAGSVARPWLDRGPTTMVSRACPSRVQTPGLDLRGHAGAARGRNVVWVILESAGARHLPAYGATRDATPHLSALATSSLLWERTYAAYPESIKGLFSVLCARPPPPDSEASDYGAGKLPCDSIAARLAAAGYRTGLFHAGRFAYLGMAEVVKARGFDHLADASSIASRFVSSFGVDERATVAALLSWVDRTAGAAPFFAVYMPIAGHHPYHAPGEAPRPFPERAAGDEHLNDLFVADEAFGRLRAGLAARGLDDHTLYVVMGDHGEAFREHPGNIAHALQLYEENVRVPLFVAAPGLLSGQRRAPQVRSLLDVGPTTLDLLGLPPPVGTEGRSALSPEPRLARFATERAFRLSGLVDGDHKLIVDPDSGRAQLYDLAADPREREDLSARRPDLVRSYRDCLPPR